MFKLLVVATLLATLIALQNPAATRAAVAAFADNHGLSFVAVETLSTTKDSANGE